MKHNDMKPGEAFYWGVLLGVLLAEVALLVAIHSIFPAIHSMFL